MVFAHLRHPSAQHPTKSLFTTPQNSLHSGPKCHTVLKLQKLSVSDSSVTVSTFLTDVDLVAKAAMSNNCLVLSQQFTEDSALFTLFKGGNNTGRKMLSLMTNNIGYVLVTVTCNAR